MDNSGKKKILYITTISGFLPQFESGDVRIAKELGYSVYYASNFDNPIYTIPENYFESNDIKCYRTQITKSPIHLIKNWKAISKLRRIIDEENIDIIHCHNPMGGVVARLAAKMSKSHPYVIYTAHGLHFYKGAPFINWLLYYPVEKLLAHYTDMIIAINQEDYQFVKKHFTLKKGGMCEIIHGVGVDIHRFAPKPEIRKSKRKELEIPDDAFHIVTAAELNKNKNQRVIIEALSQIPNTNIYYSLCGKGRTALKLEKLIKKKNLEERVRIWGYRTDMDEILQTADLFAFPSIREGLGVAAIEALSCGVPLVVSDNRGTREYARNNLNSIVCNAKDIGAFRKAIERLAGKKDVAEDLKNNCRNSIRRFSREKTESIMRSVYSYADKKVKEKEENAGNICDYGCLQSTE